MSDALEDTETEATVRRPLMSGWCANPTNNESHLKCLGYNRANPGKEFQPCPCVCHFPEPEVYECGGCGRNIIEAPHWPLDGDGDTRYTHIDRTGRALGEDCS